MDKSNSGLTTKLDFEKSLKNVGMVLARDDFNAMVAHQSENEGFDQIKLRAALVVAMNPRRANMTTRCFDIMDRTGSGKITFDEIRAFYCAKDHIDVISGVNTETEIVDMFLDHFQGAASTNDGCISKTEFIDYYTYVSQAIPNDQYFIALMEGSFLILESEELSEVDKNSVKQCLAKLKKSLQLKTSPKITLEEGISKLFTTFDKNNSGNVSLDDLYALCIFLGVSLERKYTLRIMKAIDKDNSGFISLNELQD